MPLCKAGTGNGCCEGELEGEDAVDLFNEANSDITVIRQATVIVEIIIVASILLLQTHFLILFTFIWNFESLFFIFMIIIDVF